MRRRDDADVDLSIPYFTEAGDALDLEHAQKLRLRRQRHLADLVEQHRAGGRALEQAGLRLDRSGERALLVPEQLALEQRLGGAPHS